MREFNFWETTWITELTQSQILPNCRSHSHSQWDLHQDPARPLVHHTSPFQKRQTTTIIGFVWHVRCRQVSRVKVQPTYVFSLLIMLHVSCYTYIILTVGIMPFPVLVVTSRSPKVWPLLIYSQILRANLIQSEASWKLSSTSDRFMSAQKTWGSLL